MLRNYILVIIFVLTNFWANAQENKTGRQVIEDMLEELAQSSDEGIDLEQVAEDLEHYLQMPVNLNTATYDELDKLPMLNEFQIAKLMEYIHKHGPMLTLYELQLVEGFDQTDIFRLIPFITLGVSGNDAGFQFTKALKYGHNDLFLRTTSVLEKQEGYKDVTDSVRQLYPERYYPGNASRIYSRYAFNFRDKLQAGITAEKDPGEQFFAGHQKKGFDYYSGFISLSDIGKIKTLVAGDFEAKFGQGLVSWSALGTSKSAYVLDIRKKGDGIKKYSSTDENLFFRGAATTLQFNRLEATVFGSRKAIDANTVITDTLTGTDEGFTSFGTAGIHATPNQIADEDAITESVAGFNLQYNQSRIKTGITGLAYQFDKPFVKNEAPLNRYDFEGKSNYNLSADAQYLFKSIYWFGEAAVSQNGGYAFLSGALLQLAPGLNASMLYRDYARNYQARYANGFSEGSKTQNEEGLYFCIETTPVKKIKLSAYYDFYRFAWLRTGADSPSRGDDFLVQTDVALSRDVNMYIRYKTELKEENGANGEETNGINPLVSNKKSSLRFHINYGNGLMWQFKNRVELSWYKPGQDAKLKGYLIYQDVVCSPFKYPISFTIRYALFETDSYDTRIYTYESDVLYAYSIPALYDKGTRTYLLVSWHPTDNLDIWVRGARLSYSDKKTIGTSPDLIDKSHKTEIKMMLRWKF